MTIHQPMHGYQLTFFTQQDRVHDQRPLAQWLLDQAHKRGLRGATLNGSLQGLGHDGAVHAINLFDLSDQPVQVTLVVSTEEAQSFLDHLQGEGVHVFYMKVPVEFGTVGEGQVDVSAGRSR